MRKSGGKVKSFVFFECVVLVKLTGRKAANIIEFLEVVKQVSPECVFHHMHQYFLKSHTTGCDICLECGSQVSHAHTAYYTNDFAVWVSEWLEEKSLAERLANFNPYDYPNVEELRSETIRIVEDYLREFPPPRPVLPGGEFYFNEGITIVIPTGLMATDLEGFINCLEKVDRSSIFFHFFEARLRLGREKDDFSEWLATSIGREDIAEEIRALDIYMFNLDGLKEEIKDIIRRM